MTSSRGFPFSFFYMVGGPRFCTYAIGLVAIYNSFKAEKDF